MSLKVFLPVLQIYVLVLCSGIVQGSNVSITYHIICDEGNLVSVSYKLMDSGYELFSDSIDVEKVDGIETRMVKDMCTNPHLRSGFSEFPLIPTLDHCYYTISLENPKRFPDQYGINAQVSRYVMVHLKNNQLSYY